MSDVFTEKDKLKSKYFHHNERGYALEAAGKWLREKQNEVLFDHVYAESPWAVTVYYQKRTI